VRIELKEGGHCVDFKACHMNGWSVTEGGDVPCFDTPENEPTDDFDKAEVFVEGFIKWDGCTNFEFTGQRDTMLHRCEAEELLAIGTLLSRIHERAMGMMPES
jgi:hypothetical protein